MSLLSQPVKNLGGLKALELSEGRQFLSQCYYLELQSGASEPYYGAHYPQLAPHQAIYQRGSSTTSTVSTLDFTEVLLAAACSCGALKSVHGKEIRARRMNCLAKGSLEAHIVTYMWNTARLRKLFVLCEVAWQVFLTSKTDICSYDYLQLGRLSCWTAKLGP